MADPNEQQNWKNLLLMSTGASGEPSWSGPEDAGESSEARNVINPEDMEFITNAMAQVTKKDEKTPNFSLYDELIKYETACVDENMTDEELLAATDLAEQIDDFLVSNNFSQQFLEPKVLIALERLTVQAYSPELRHAFLQLIPEFVSNREEFQAVMWPSKLFESLVGVLSHQNTTPPFLITSTIAAISPCVTNSMPAFHRLMQLDGLEKLRKIVVSVIDNQSSARAARAVHSIFFSLFWQATARDESRKSEEEEIKRFNEEAKKNAKKGEEPVLKISTMDQLIIVICEAVYELRRKLECVESNPEDDDEHGNNRRRLDQTFELCTNTMTTLRLSEIPVAGRAELALYWDNYKDKDAGEQTMIALNRVFGLDGVEHEPEDNAREVEDPEDTILRVPHPHAIQLAAEQAAAVMAADAEAQVAGMLAEDQDEGSVVSVDPELD